MDEEKLITECNKYNNCSVCPHNKGKPPFHCQIEQDLKGGSEER